MYIEPARPGDERCLAELNATVQRLHATARPDVFKPVNVDEVSAWFAAKLALPATRAWIARVEDSAAGYVLVIERERADNPFVHGGAYWEIEQLGVEPQFRRRGVGGALLEHTLAAAEQRGIRDMEVASWAFNTQAHSVLRRMGFVPRMLRFEHASSGGGSR